MGLSDMLGYSGSGGRGGSSSNRYTRREDFTGGISARLGQYRKEKASHKSGSTKIGPKETKAQTIVALLASEEKGTRDRGRELLRDHIGDLTPRLKREYFGSGRFKDYLDSVEKDVQERKRGGVLGALFGHDRKKSLVTQVMHTPAAIANAAKVPQIVEVAGRAQHATMEGIQAVKEQGGSSGLTALAGPKTREYVRKQSGFGDVLQALAGDETYDSTTLQRGHSLDYANALGVDLNTAAKSGWQRNLGKTASFVGGAALDPVNLVGGGGTVAEAAKGTRALATVVATDKAVLAGKKAVSTLAIADAEREIARLGARKATTQAQRRAAIDLLKEENKAAGVTQNGLRVAAKNEDKAAKRFVDAAVNRDRGGLRVGYRTVNREGIRDPVRRVLKDTVTPLTEQQQVARLFGRASGRAEELSKQAARQEHFANRAAARAEAIRTSRQASPYFKLEDRVTSLYDQLEGLKSLAPSGIITEDMVDEDTMNLLTRVSHQLDDAASRANAFSEYPTPNELLTPYTRSLGERADEFRSLLQSDAPDRFDKLAALMYDRVSAVPTGEPTWARVPGMDIVAAESAASDVLKPLAKEARQSSKAHAAAVSAAEIEAAKAKKALDKLGSPDGVKLTRPAKKALRKAQQREVAASAKVADLLSERSSLQEVLAAGNPEDLVSKFPELAAPTENISSIERGAVSKVLDTTGLRSVTDWGKEHLSPYSRVRNSHSLDGERTVAAVQNLRGQTRAAMIDHNEMVTNSILRAQKGVGGMTDAEVTVIRDALDRGGNVTETVDLLRAEGKAKQADYLEHLDTIRRDDNAMMIEKGLSSENTLIPIDDYLGRVLTPRGRRALELGKKREADMLAKHGVTTQASVTAKQGGHTLARQVHPDWSISQIESTLGRDLRDQGFLGNGFFGRRHGDRLYEQSPGVATVTRSRQIAASAAQADFIDGLARDVRGNFGEELVTRIHPGMADADAAAARRVAKESGLTKIDLGPAGEVWAHPDLAPEIANVTRLTGSADGVREIGKMWDAWNKTWAAYATTPLITGTSFSARNAQGNIFLAVLAGLKNPDKFREAGWLQNQAWRAVHARPDLPFADALKEAGIKESARARLIAAAENGVIKEGFAHHDLGDQAASLLHEAGSKNPLRKVFKPSTVSDNPVTRSGRAFNAAVEDNARLAVFLDQMDKTGDIAGSVSHVKKYLFDYSELTPFESRHIKRVNKFYTFARKATPLVFKELADNPSRFVQMSRAEKAAFGQRDLAPGEVQPGYLADGAQGRPSNTLSALFGMGGDGFAVGGLDTPVTAAQKSVQPISDLLSGDGSQFARDTLSLTSGGPVEFVKLLADKASGSSMFTGGSLTDKHGRNKRSDAVRVISTLFPVAAKGEGLRKQGITDMLPRGDKPDAKAKAAALKAIFGVNATLVTNEQQDAIRTSEIYKIKDILDMLRETDPSIPTISELRRVGILPETESKKSKGGSSSKPDFSASSLFGGN